MVLYEIERASEREKEVIFVKFKIIVCNIRQNKKFLEWF